MAFDDLTKQSFKEKFGDAVNTDVKVGALEKSFDILLNGKDPNILQSQIIPQSFQLFENNFIEYKSSRDIYHLYELYKLNGDFSYYCYNKKMEGNYGLKTSALWFIVANDLPFNREAQSWDLIQYSHLNGYYRVQNSYPPLHIIVLEELEEDVKQNAFLLLFASAKKFSKFVKVLNRNDALIQELKKFIIRKLYVEGREVEHTEDVAILKQKLEFEYEKNIRDSVIDLGLEKVIAAVGLEKVIESIPEEQLQEVEKIIRRRNKKTV